MNNGEVISLSWNDIYRRLQSAPAGRLFGIPRGGAIVAGLTGRAIDRIQDADFLVDDIVDSGTTKERWLAHGKPFWSLVDKVRDGFAGHWVKFPWEETDPTKDLEETVVRQLESIGENPKRDGLLGTPSRVIRSLFELTNGYKQDPVSILGTTFNEKYDEMVVVRDIDFHSLCEHHLLPFVGKATVAYIPKDCVVGLSKIARLVHCFALRLQVQERMTVQIATTLQNVLNPLGVAVMMRSAHFCMRLRGIKSTGDMVTTCLLGYFKERQDTREEFLRACGC